VNFLTEYIFNDKNKTLQKEKINAPSKNKKLAFQAARRHAANLLAHRLYCNIGNSSLCFHRSPHLYQQLFRINADQPCHGNIASLLRRNIRLPDALGPPIAFGNRCHL